MTTIKSPELHADGTVTLRLDAPNAGMVALTGGHIALGLGLPGETKLPYARNAEGIWELTIGPLPPDLYDYWVEVDGVGIVDPANLRVKHGAMTPGSQLWLPGPAADYFSWQNVPHGAVHRHLYYSQVAHAPRVLTVYTPPGYDPTVAAYPVLYLLHGMGEVGGSWADIGAANLIADNLLAAGRMQPMLIVMPHGHINEDFDGDWVVRLHANLFRMQEELFGHVIPLVERQYHVGRQRAARALAGLSMGGMQTEIIGFRHLDQFAALGLFSGTSRARAEFVDYAALLPPVDALNTLDDLLLGCGEQDTWFIDDFNALHAQLTETGVRHRYVALYGGHTWSVWRALLAHHWLPYLFQPAV